MAKTTHISVLVREQADALDGFMAEVGLGVRNQRQLAELDEQLAKIISGLQAARREGRYH